MGKYIGRDNPYGLFETQTLTPTGSATTFTLTYRVSSASSILVVYSGQVQKPDDDYALSNGGTQIVFDSAPSAGFPLYIVYLGRELATSPGTIVPDGDKGAYITVSNEGATWTIKPSSITYDRIQNVSATDKILGRSSAGAGAIQEITCTAAGRNLLDDVDATAQRTTLGLGTLATQSGTFSGTSSGTNTGDQNLFSTISVTGNATTITANSLTTNLNLEAGAGITLTPNNTTKTVTIASSALSDGDKGDITVSNSGSTWTIDSQAVSFSKIQNITGPSLLGRQTGTGSIEQLTLGSGFVLSAGTLNYITSFADGSQSSPGVYFTNETTMGMFRAAAGTLAFSTASTERLRITSTGQIQVGNGSAAAPVLSFSSDTNTGIFRPAEDNIAISTGGTERFRINNAGYVGIGTSSPDVALSIEGLTQAVSSISSTRYFNDQYSSEFLFKKSRSGTVGVNAAVSLNDTLGMISFKGADGTTYANSARILATVTDTITSGIIPGSLAFQTANASGTLTTRLTLDHLGNIIGAGQFEGITGSASSPSFSFSVDTNTGMFRPAEDILAISTGGIERLRVNNNGKVRIGGVTEYTSLSLSFLGGQDGITIQNHDSASTQANIFLRRSKGTTFTDFTAVAAGDSLAAINMQGSDGTGFTTGARISAIVNSAGTVSSTSMPLDIIFATCPNGSITATTRMTVTSEGQILINGTGTAGAPSLCAGNDSNTGIFVPAADTWAVATNGSERVRIDSTGKLGIGTTSPDAPLDVETASSFSQTGNDSIRITNSSATGQAVLQAQINGTLRGRWRVDFNGAVNYAANGSDHIFYTGGDATVGTERFRINNAGQVLIGTSASAGSSGSISYLKFGSGTTWQVGPGSNGSGNEYWIVNGSDVGVRLSSGSTSWATVSDQRQKKNIQTLEYGLSQIHNLRPVRFDYISDESNNSSRIGFIAQEVLPHIPEAVSGSEEDYYGVAITEIIPVLVGAIKELNAKIELLTARIEELE